MRSILALVRIHWLTFTSYRLNLLFSFAGLVALLVPVYLVGRALQPVAAASIADEGEVYFGFLIAGIAVMQLVGASVRTLPGSISSGIASGTFEALLTTPTPLPQLLAGLLGYGLGWAAIRTTLLLVALAVLGGPLAPAAIPVALLVLLLIVAVHVAVGIAVAAAVVVFRTIGPLVPALLGAFSLLGGVYYSTSVIPEVVRPLASIVPLTYGLRAFRQTLLSGEGVATVATDLAALAAFALVLMVLSLVLFARSLRYARRMGTLAQY